MACECRVRVPLKTRRVEGMMHVESVKAHSPPVDVVCKLNVKCRLECLPRHLTTAVNYEVRCEKPSCSLAAVA
ncbi:hypothetical protein TNCV_4613731 [Trichonephila clavipes]|nr:hypothetical protein TNCV_4613731 [Trichonephila clavipes]